MRKLVLVFMSIFSLCLCAQQSTIASGGELSGDGGQASFSLGQLFYESANGSYTEGVQLASEVSYISGEVIIIEHHSGLMLLCANKDKQWISYQWFCNEEEISTLNYCFEPQGLNGIYYLVVTDANGNQFYSARYAYTTNKSATRSLSLYPVPVMKQENLHVFYSNPEKAESIEELSIIDMQGKQVYTRKVKVGMKHIIDVSNLPSGVYTVSIDGEKSKIIVR